MSAPSCICRRTVIRLLVGVESVSTAVTVTGFALGMAAVPALAWGRYDLALAAILLGNAIVLVPMVLNAHAGTKYGVSFPVLCRAAFGVKGANVPAVLLGDRALRLVPVRWVHRIAAAVFAALGAAVLAGVGH